MITEEQFILNMAAELIPAARLMPIQCQLTKYESKKSMITVYKDPKGRLYVKKRNYETGAWSRDIKVE